MVDSDKRVFTAVTNCAGNFYVLPGQFAPHYPMWVSVMSRGSAAPVLEEPMLMETPTFREGSCAACHKNPMTPKNARHVFMFFDAQNLPGTKCSK